MVWTENTLAWIAMLYAFAVMIVFLVGCACIFCYARVCVCCCPDNERSQAPDPLAVLIYDNPLDDIDNPERQSSTHY